VRVAVALAALMMVIAGCGGRSEGEAFREDSLRPLEQRLDVRRARVAATLRVVRAGSRRDAAALREDIGALEGGVRRIAALVPPSSAQQPFARYVGALRELVAELRRFSAALRADQPAAMRDIATRLRDATGAVQSEHDALEQALVGDS